MCVVGGKGKNEIIEIHCAVHEWITTSKNKQVKGYNGREYVDMCIYDIANIHL